MKVRALPVELNASQFVIVEDAVNLVEASGGKIGYVEGLLDSPHLRVQTNHGIVKAYYGDWVVQEVDKSFTVMTNNAFMSRFLAPDGKQILVDDLAKQSGLQSSIAMAFVNTLFDFADQRMKDAKEARESNREFDELTLQSIEKGDLGTWKMDPQ